MVMCQARSCKLVVEGRTLYFQTAKEKREAKEFYQRNGFTIGKQKAAR